MTLTPLDIASLAKNLSRWELGEYICAGLVTVACLGEFVGEFTNWFTHGVEKSKDHLRKISTLVLVCALALELVCIVQTNILSGRLVGYLQEEVMVQSPRGRLLEAGKDKFNDALKPFAGQRFMIVECGRNPSPEPYKLEEDLESFLSDAKWNQVPVYASWDSCAHGTGNGATSDGGNLVAFNSNASKETKDAATALFNVLNELSIFTASFQAPPTPSPTLQQLLGSDSPFVRASTDSTVIFILVGLNPQEPNRSGHAITH